ncbi:M23 family metallopeptidase [Marinobacterium rhizophilum]|uniref:M23 family metallopeptidase n=1 Tax=Marinobacterium rhizophilum TaxID=420402 RepID=A0ABY5HPC8_9GAMM|nr:M23 family metallopeptidase [Marinobacterium rhizophilum]UTW13814.1 M23 family metallopeptidase [Marinobacterium rhizophilum]
MKNKLIVTLTTVKGSRQYTLNQVARVLVPAFLLMAVLSFFVSNALLVKTTDDLSILEEDHQLLADQYETVLGTQQLYVSELNQLSSTLELLQQENYRIGELNASLDESLGGLESMLGLPASDSYTPEQAEVLKATAAQRLFLLHNIPNGVPIQGTRMSDRFGMRTHPVTRKRSMHNGVDFAASRGTDVYATADGVVEFSGRQSGFGKLVIMQHSFGFKTYFAHLDKLNVEAGDLVAKGQLIAQSGNSGRSTGPHLHYEIRRLYTAIDPAPFLKWNIANFDTIFTDVTSVKWASLRKMYPLNQAAVQLPSSLKETDSPET